MYWYKQSFHKDIGVDDVIKKASSLFSKILFGSWLHHVFLVFDYIDEKTRKMEKFSIDFSKDGFDIKLGSRVFENRKDHALEYASDLKPF